MDSDLRLLEREFNSDPSNLLTETKYAEALGRSLGLYPQKISCATGQFLVGESLGTSYGGGGITYLDAGSIQAVLNSFIFICEYPLTSGLSVIGSISYAKAYTV